MTPGHWGSLRTYADYGFALDMPTPRSEKFGRESWASGNMIQQIREAGALR